VVKIQVLGFCVHHRGIAWYVDSEAPEQPSAFLTRTRYWDSIFAHLWNVCKSLPKYTLPYLLTSKCAVMSCDVHINCLLKLWI